MNRRDIIIITVLINTGLLSALAMMAINTEDQGYIDQTEFSQLASNTPNDLKDHDPVALVQSTTSSTDEWDTVLKDYVASNSSQMVQPLEDLTDEVEIPEMKQQVQQQVKQQVAQHVKPPEVNQQTQQPIKQQEPKKPVTVPVIVKEVQKKPVVQPQAVSLKKPTVEITVKRGDMLEKIARANGTTVEQIRILNNLKNDRLTVGQTLLVPADSERKIIAQAVKPEMTTQKKNSVDEVEYYVIKSGDNPWKIAKQYNVKFDDLLKLNHLDEEKARNLKIGDRIRVK